MIKHYKTTRPRRMMRVILCYLLHLMLAAVLCLAVLWHKYFVMKQFDSNLTFFRVLGLE